MSAQTLFAPDYLAKMMEVFAASAEAGNSKRNRPPFTLSSPPRLVDIMSRQGIDVSASPYKDDGGKVTLFSATSPAAAPTIPSSFVLSEEPRFESGQPTNNNTIFGLMGIGFQIDGATDAQANAALLAMSSAYVEVRIANTVIAGPITVGEYLAGPPANQYGGITGSIDKGNVRNDRNYYIFGQPLIVAPGTTFSVTLVLEGSRFAGLSVTDDLRFTATLKALVADGQINNR